MYYRNAAQNRYGVKTAPAAENSASSPPSQVTGFGVGGVTSSSVDLSWNLSTDEDSSNYRYRIYRGGQLAGSTTSGIFTDTELAAGTTYSYQVSAITQDGVEGPKSVKRTATTLLPAPDTPSQVVGLAIGAVTTSSIDLSWNASQDPDSGSYRYRVYRNGKLVATKSATSFKDSGLESGTLYSYQVSALNQSNVEGPKSGKKSATTLTTVSDPPSRVSGLTIVDITTETLYLTWNPSDDPNAADYRYRIYRDSQLIATQSSASFRDSGLTPGTTYGYQVSAVDRSEVEGPKSYKESATTATQVGTAPSIVRGLGFSAVDSTSIDLTWDASKDPKSNGYRYYVYRWGELIGVTRKTTFRDIDLTPDTRYLYQVSAVSEDGVEGPLSQKRRVSTDEGAGPAFFADGLESGNFKAWSSVRR